MKKNNSTIARLLAVAALVVAVVVVVSVVNSETGDDSPVVEKKSKSGKTGNQGNNPEPEPTKKVYVVQEGDSLVAIARKNGVSVARIERLNPNLDPQALIPGQKLKLR
jgi:LysM repeat protein